MEKFLLGILIAVFSWSGSLFALPECDVQDSNGEQSEFWPADMVPHPHLPGSGPTGPGESKIV
ncbi:MAG: hypothetical protein K940chlam9_00587 [Chlamydiae bacterium]|nr:hypothetical protein [Chlamydiota bacterium]